MTVNRTLALLGTAALLVGGSAAAQTTSGSGIRVSKDGPGVSKTPSTMEMSAGEVKLETPFVLSTYANMNEKNIAAHMAAGDSLEIQMAELALNKATSAAVRNYASTLLSGHRAHLAKVTEIITDEDVGAEPLANDPEGRRMRQMLQHLRTMKAGANWDAAFVRFQIQHHQNEIDLLTPVEKNIHDDDFEALYKETLTSLASHRDMGKNVAHGLGIH